MALLSGYYLQFTVEVLYCKAYVIIYLQAENKGMSSTVIGLLFSVTEFVIFITAPFFGNYVSSTIKKRLIYIHFLMSILLVHALPSYQNKSHGILGHLPKVTYQRQYHPV